VVFAVKPDQALLAHLRLAGIGEIWTVPTRPGLGQRLHAGDLQMQALRSCGLTGSALPPPSRLESPTGPGSGVIAPGSGGTAKRLGPELAASLAACLAEAYGPPLVVLGPAEASERDPIWREELERALAAVPHRLFDCPSIADLAQALRAAPLYAGADSGVTHLAAALGAPTLAVFQASDPAVWAPREAEVCVPDRAEAALAKMLRYFSRRAARPGAGLRLRPGQRSRHAG
jgi:hypothetical protein